MLMHDRHLDKPVNAAPIVFTDSEVRVLKAILFAHGKNPILRSIKEKLDGCL